MTAEVAVPIIVAAIGASVGWLTVRDSRRRNRADAENNTSNAAQKLIDQLQEERLSDRAVHDGAIANLRHDTSSRMADMESRMGRMEDRERLLLDYVEELRVHISHGKPPPPPPWPEGLMGRG